MPLKVNVGLSKKTGQPDFGSLGASVHVEYEADSALLTSDLEGFHRQVRNAFVACRQAVQDELGRRQLGDQCEAPAVGPNGRHGSNGHSGSPRRGGPRKATASQVRAIESIADRLQLDLASWPQQKFGLRLASELSTSEASSTIDELKANSTNNHGGRS